MNNSAMIAKETLKILEHNLKFSASINRQWMDEGGKYEEKPISKWSRLRYKVSIYKGRLKDAWKVLIGDAEIDYYD